MESVLKPQKRQSDKWHKEPWLLLVVGGPLIVVAASIFTGYVAFSGADKVVAEDYYKQGLMINKDIQRDAKARELHLSANLSLHAAQSLIRVEVTGAGELPEQIQMSLANASPNAAKVTEIVHRIPLIRVAPGVYEGELKQTSNISDSSVKLFHIKLETTDWRLTGDWFEPEQKAAQLNASK
ncbi:FixH family protein [Undibacterium curvum]|uniref:FixH family protein n=1 Tax=Undibacterium curvum TaxID=2762294 RepID=A0ABR6ZZL7_9BURK|nr:FixH family protein [Undibacterium curvum]MBC3930084.1 FixH family protein [Undibacterium curvum]